MEHFQPAEEAAALTSALSNAGDKEHLSCNCTSWSAEEARNTELKVDPMQCQFDLLTNCRAAGQSERPDRRKGRECRRGEEMFRLRLCYC